MNNQSDLLTLNEAREWLRAEVLPDNWRQRLEVFAEFYECPNCDGRKCMGCVMREYDHDCADDCPFCCEVPA